MVLQNTSIPNVLSASLAVPDSNLLKFILNPQQNAQKTMKSFQKYQKKQAKKTAKSQAQAQKRQKKLHPEIR